MSSKSTTFIARINAGRGFTTRTSSTVTYTHACLTTGRKGGDEGAISWHKTEANATKAAESWRSHGYSDVRVVPVEARNGSKVTVERALEMEKESNDRVKAKAAPIKAKKLTGEAKKAYDERVARLAADQAKPSTRTLPPVEKKAPKAKAAPAPAKAELIASNPGYVTSTKSRSTKTVAVLIDGTAGHPLALDVAKGKWQTICLDHKATAAHPGQRPARDQLGHPELWCPKCKKATKA